MSAGSCGCCGQCRDKIVLLRKQEGRRILVSRCPTCGGSTVFDLDEMLKGLELARPELDISGVLLSPGPKTSQ